MAGNVLPKVRMRKIFITSVDGNEIVLSGDDHNHLAYSMRSRVGDEVVACCDGTDYTCEITQITAKNTILRVISYQAVTTEPEVDVTLFAAILKGDKLEYAVQKTTELGVKEIALFQSKNCECRPESVRLTRLEKIAEEGAKQCGRGRIPTITPIVPFDTVIERLKEFDMIVFPYEKAEKPDLKTYLGEHKGKKIAVLVGSEGGFTLEEAEKAKQAGALPITLGSRIMRAETAMIAVCSVVFYENGEWSKV